MSNFVKGAIISGVIIVVAIILGLMSTVTIKPGYAGIVYNMSGGVQRNVLGQGWHGKWPSQHVISYPVSTETVFLSKNADEGKDKDQSFDINSKSGKTVNVDASYSYHMDANKLPDIFTKFRGQDANTIEDNFIRRDLKSCINNITSQYEVMDIYGSARPQIKAQVMAAFSKDMAQYGIIIESFDFPAIRPDAASLKAIQDKVDAEQSLQKAQIAQQQAQVDAQTAVVKAKGDADAKVASAEGEAKANASLNANITPELVQYKSLEVQKAQADAMSKWNVNTFVNGNSTPLLNVPENTAQPKK